jgi:hypothetical protein
MFQKILQDEPGPHGKKGEMPNIYCNDFTV